MEEKKTRKPRKKPASIKEAPEAVYIYHDGDDIHAIAKALTGHSYMVFKILEYNKKSFHDLKDGDLIRWGL